MLSLPSGQRATLRSQSTVKSAEVNASPPLRLCKLQVLPPGTDKVDAVLRAGSDEVVGADIGGVHQVFGRSQVFCSEHVVENVNLREDGNAAPSSDRCPRL